MPKCPIYFGVILALAMVCVVPVLSQPVQSATGATLIEQEFDDLSVSLQNPYIHSRFNIEDGIKQVSLNFFKETYLTPLPATGEVQDSHPFFHSLRLFTQHPKDGLDEVRLHSAAMSESISADDSQTIRLEAQSSNGLVLHATLSINAVQSIQYVTTTLVNRGESTIELFPAEVLRMNAEAGRSGSPNLLCHAHVPVGPAIQATDDIELDIGSATPQLKLFPEKSVLEVIYQNQKMDFWFKRSDDWFSIKPRRAGPALGMEWHFPEEGLASLEENTRVFTTYRPLNQRNWQTQPHLLGAWYVHGKLLLEPGESYTYRQIWNASVLPSPVIDVDNGVTYFSKVNAMAYQNAFYFFGSMGSPADGRAAVEFYSRDGELITTEPLSVYNPFMKSGLRNEVTMQLPVYLTSSVTFGFSEGDLNPENRASYMWERASRIRVIVRDEDGNFLKALGEDREPWQRFRR